jgi:hypothetical protein
MSLAFENNRDFAPAAVVRVEGTLLRVGELAPLCSGMKLRLGKMDFCAQVED